MNEAVHRTAPAALGLLIIHCLEFMQRQGSWNEIQHKEKAWQNGMTYIYNYCVVIFIHCALVESMIHMS